MPRLTSKLIAMTVAILLLSSLTLSAQGTLLHAFEGSASGDRLGQTVAAAGDVDADGFGDVIVGAPYDATIGGGAGLARVYSGADGSILYTFYADAPGDKFGDAVNGAGDVDADGHADVIVGAILADPNGSASGRARVYSGFDGSVLFTFTGDAPGDGLGSSVAGGDVNGDGFSDLIVGIESDDDTFPNAGSVRVFSGLDGGLLYQLDGDTAQGRFGGSVSDAGDVNGDGIDDIIVGAYRGNHNGLLSGSAKVFSGPTGTLLFALGGDAATDEFGTSVSGLGDVDGDGRGDFIVGAPHDDNNGASSGSARVFSGLDASVLHDLDGGNQADQFGYSVGRAGDIDGDGFADFIVGAPKDDFNIYNCGRALVYSGVAGTLLYSVAGPANSDGMGTSVSGAGDVDGDGFADIVVGMPGDDANGSNSGEARVYTSPLLPTLVYSSDSGPLDLALAWTPDGGNVQSLTGALTCNGGTPGGIGLYGVSFAPGDSLISVGFPVLIAVDSINLIESGNFGYGFLGEVLVPNVTRQYPAIAGTDVYLQFFEISPIIRGSNGLRLLMSM